MSIHSARLLIEPAPTKASRWAAFSLIRRAGLEASLGLPAVLSHADFERPFRGPLPPSAFLFRDRVTRKALGLALLWQEGAGSWSTIHYGLALEVRGRGLASEGVGALVRSLIEGGRVIGIRAVIAESNAASLRVARAAGLKPLSNANGWIVCGAPSNLGLCAAG